MSQQQGKGMSPDQLYQSFTKNVTNIQNGFQMLFDGMGQLQQELLKAQQELEQLKGKAMPKTTSKKDEPKIKVKTKKAKK